MASLVKWPETPETRPPPPQVLQCVLTFSLELPLRVKPTQLMAGWKYLKFCILVQKVNSFKGERSVKEWLFRIKETCVEISSQVSTNFDWVCILSRCSSIRLCYSLVLLPPMRKAHLLPPVMPTRDVLMCLNVFEEGSLVRGGQGQGGVVNRAALLWKLASLVCC